MKIKNLLPNDDNIKKWLSRFDQSQSFVIGFTIAAILTTIIACVCISTAYAEEEMNLIYSSPSFDSILTPGNVGPVRIIHDPLEIQGFGDNAELSGDPDIRYFHNDNVIVDSNLYKSLEVKENRIRSLEQKIKELERRIYELEQKQKIEWKDVIYAPLHLVCNCTSSIPPICYCW